MPDWHVLTMLGLGFMLGLRHALDADHVVAVSTILARTSSVWRSSAIGVCWGLGHTLMLLVAGAVVIGFKIAIPPPIAQWFEFGVGMMLIFLGASLAWALYHEEWHWHAHEHDGARHVHLHHHQASAAHDHRHWFEGGLKPFVVGMIHGLAGSAALLLLVVSAVQTVTEGLTAIMVFGVGSIVGMMVVGAVVSLPMIYAQSWGPVARLSARGLVSIGSMAVGVWTMVETGLFAALF